jgi:putative protease
VAYSGQCLTSEALGGRSANRGQCAQACRLPYELIVDGAPRDLGDRAYLLSPQDLAAFDLIDPLIEAGVISFKIEGRLKGGPYVAATTQTYRAAIDAKLEARDFQLSRREQLDLAQTFSRGLTPGFLEGVNHQKLVRGRFPKSRGIRLGRVGGFVKGGVRIELCESFPDLVRAGDGVLFDIGKPETHEPGGRVWRVNVQGATVELYFEAGAIDFTQVHPGCDVYKTDDPVLRKRLEQSYAQDKPARRLVLTGRVSGALGGALALTLSDGEHEARAVWAGPLEAARKQPTSAEDVREQLARLGDTPFELGKVAVELPAGVMVPRSVLNDLRRQAAGELAERRIAVRQHAIADGDALEELRTTSASGGREPSEAMPTEVQAGAPERYAAQVGVVSPRGAHAPRSPRLTVLVRSLEQLDAVLAWAPPHDLPQLAAVYCDFEDLRRYKDAVPKARAAGVLVGVAPLRVWKPGEDGFQALVVRAEPDIVLVRNLASVGYFKEQLPTAQLIGDFSLNVANELTADLLIRAGLERLVPSFDLNWEQFVALVRRSPPSWYEAVAHQHMPMFHMEHCVFATFLSTGKDHRDCGRPCERHKVELRDRVGAPFPVLPDTGCRNTVFNSVPQSAAEYVGRMRELGITRFRVDLLRETADQVGPLLERYARVVAGRDDGRETWRQLRALNQLGVTRGTLQLL